MSDDPRTTLRALLPFVSAHLPEVTDLWVESWTRTMPTIDFEARRGWFVDHVSAAMERGEALRVAVTETGDVAGFVMIDPATGYLDQIVVGVDWWGTGIAEALVGEARRISPSLVRLKVNEDNPRAVGFYRRQGFAVTGRTVAERSGLPVLEMTWRP